MPQEEVLLAFWIIEGKYMLKRVELGTSESWENTRVRKADGTSREGVDCSSTEFADLGVDSFTYEAILIPMRKRSRTSTLAGFNSKLIHGACPYT